mmetsp:Transcript_15061/g.46785  ORF Transcript_15061/g.46785 Transcript_15061/m.46785 type:complete len:262 (+) Transcript_15061:764-1549(+)
MLRRLVVLGALLPPEHAGLRHAVGQSGHGGAREFRRAPERRDRRRRAMVAVRGARAEEGARLGLQGGDSVSLVAARRLREINPRVLPAVDGDGAGAAGLGVVGCRGRVRPVVRAGRVSGGRGSFGFRHAREGVPVARRAPRAATGARTARRAAARGARGARGRRVRDVRGRAAGVQPMALRLSAPARIRSRRLRRVPRVGVCDDGPSPRRRGHRARAATAGALLFGLARFFLRDGASLRVSQPARGVFIDGARVAQRNFGV